MNKLEQIALDKLQHFIVDAITVLEQINKEEDLIQKGVVKSSLGNALDVIRAIKENSKTYL